MKEFFGPTGGWEAAFVRFLRAPPSGAKDRAAMQDVTAFLIAGTDHMCPRGFQVIANAAEVKAVMISSPKVILFLLSRRPYFFSLLLMAVVSYLCSVMTLNLIYYLGFGTVSCRGTTTNNTADSL